jgi:hypothetical protein
MRTCECYAHGQQPKALPDKLMHLACRSGGLEALCSCQRKKRCYKSHILLGERDLGIQHCPLSHSSPSSSTAKQKCCEHRGSSSADGIAVFLHYFPRD